MRSSRDDRFAYDIWILLPVIFLVGMGLVVVFSSSSILAMREATGALYYFRRQGIFAMLGLGVLLFFRHFPYRFFKMQGVAYLVLLGALISLVMVQIPGLGTEAGGATRWLNLGFISFQPSELVKVSLVLFLAYSLTRKQKQLNRWTVSLIPHFIILAPFGVLILMQPDFGAFVMVCLITLIMLFIGGVRLKHLIAVLLPVVTFSLWYLFQADYRVRRLMAFMNPDQHQTGDAWQLKQSLIAFASGGLIGQGPGQGGQKMGYLPESHTDFIFSIIGEEYGFVGVTLVIVLYAILVFRGMQISHRTRDRFGALMAAGLTTILALQVSINMGVTLGLLPTKGLTLPFLSYGGTSLLLNMACVGMLMNIGLSEESGETNGAVYPVRRGGDRRSSLSGNRNSRNIPATASR